MKLNTAVAIEKSVKQSATEQVTEVHTKCKQHPGLFNGQTRTYQSINVEGDQFPSENVKVQLTADHVLDVLRQQYTAQFDATATKDSGNQIGKASVVVDGKTIITGAPVPFLLFAEKQLAYVKTFIEKIPALDGVETWTKDLESQLYKSEPTKAVKSKKVQKVLTLAQATDKFPAQAQVITDDEQVGYWTHTRLSGAISAVKKRELLDKVEKLCTAFALAREEANDTVIPAVQCGDNIFSYLFGD